MSGLVALVWLCATTGIEITVAPDQPIPYVYVDDPLIVELHSTGDTDATAFTEVEIEGDNRLPVTIKLGSVPLRAGATHWQVVPGVPSERGRYRARFSLDLNGTRTEVVRTFCRIDRPKPIESLILGANLAQYDPKALLALSGIPLRSVRLSAALPELDAHVQEARDGGFEVILALEAERLDNPIVIAEDLSRRLGDKVGRWDLDAGRAQEQLKSLAEAIRRGGSRAPLALVAEEPGALAAFLANGGGLYAGLVLVRPSSPAVSDIPAYRAAAEAAGYEGMVFTVLSQKDRDPAPQSDEHLIAAILANYASGASQALVDMPLIFENGEFQEAYSYLSALSRRLDRSAYVGDLNLPPPSAGHVFRLGGRWVAVFWTTGEIREVTVQLGAATDLILSDASNNSLPVPEVSDGNLTFKLGPQPKYLGGSGGAILGRAASNRARKEAEKFLDNKELQKSIPSELVDAVRALAAADPVKADRAHFFGVLRLLPAIEVQWHAAELSRASAVPALANVARLAHALCVVEEEKGEPFLEPLKETLARCGEYQSRYITSSGNAVGGHERGDWLLAEVNRLIAEAEQLARDGRPIEADAVATLAEWRARALEHVVKAAPLSQPEKPLPVETPPAVEEKAPEEKVQPSKTPSKSTGKKRKTR